MVDFVKKSDIQQVAKFVELTAQEIEALGNLVINVRMSDTQDSCHRLGSVNQEDRSTIVIPNYIHTKELPSWISQFKTCWAIDSHVNTNFYSGRYKEFLVGEEGKTYQLAVDGLCKIRDYFLSDIRQDRSNLGIFHSVIRCWYGPAIYYHGCLLRIRLNHYNKQLTKAKLIEMPMDLKNWRLDYQYYFYQ